MTRNSARRAGERGSSAVEFSLVVAAMAAMIVGVVMGVGPVVSSMFNRPCADIASRTDTACPDPRDPADDTAAQDTTAGQSLRPAPGAGRTATGG